MSAGQPIMTRCTQLRTLSKRLTDQPGSRHWDSQIQHQVHIHCAFTDVLNSLFCSESLPKPPQNPFLNGLLPSEHIRNTLKRIRTADLDDALMTLPFDEATHLLKYLDAFIKAVLADTDLQLAWHCFMNVTVHRVTMWSCACAVCYSCWSLTRIRFLSPCLWFLKAVSL